MPLLPITTTLDIGAAIRHRRKLLGLDQAELASRAGVSRQWLIQVENGKQGAAIGRLLFVLNVLGLRFRLDPDSVDDEAGAEPSDPMSPNAIVARHRTPHSSA